MDPDTSWQGSPAAAARKAVEAEYVAALRSYVQRRGKTGTVDAKGLAKRTDPSGAPDPKSIAGTAGFDGRCARGAERHCWIRQAARVEDIDFARSKPENAAPFNHARSSGGGWRRSPCATLSGAPSEPAVASTP